MSKPTAPKKFFRIGRKAQKKMAQRKTWELEVNIPVTTNYLNCVQCHRYFEEPVSLACGHLVCKIKCAFTKISDCSIECPSCKEKTDLAEGIDSLEIVRTFDRVLDQLKSGVDPGMIFELRQTELDLKNEGIANPSCGVKLERLKNVIEQIEDEKLNPKPVKQESELQTSDMRFKDLMKQRAAKLIGLPKKDREALVKFWKEKGVRFPPPPSDDVMQELHEKCQAQAEQLSEELDIVNTDNGTGVKNESESSTNTPGKEDNVLNAETQAGKSSSEIPSLLEMKFPRPQGFRPQGGRKFAKPVDRRQSAGSSMLRPAYMHDSQEEWSLETEGTQEEEDWVKEERFSVQDGDMESFYHAVSGGEREPEQSMPRRDFIPRRPGVPPRMNVHRHAQPKPGFPPHRGSFRPEPPGRFPGFPSDGGPEHTGRFPGFHGNGDHEPPGRFRDIPDRGPFPGPRDRSAGPGDPRDPFDGPPNFHSQVPQGPFSQPPLMGHNRAPMPSQVSPPLQPTQNRPPAAPPPGQQHMARLPAPAQQMPPPRQPMFNPQGYPQPQPSLQTPFPDKENHSGPSDPRLRSRTQMDVTPPSSQAEHNQPLLFPSNPQFSQHNPIPPFPQSGQPPQMPHQIPPHGYSGPPQQESPTSVQSAGGPQVTVSAPPVQYNQTPQQPQQYPSYGPPQMPSTLPQQFNQPPPTYAASDPHGFPPPYSQPPPFSQAMQYPPPPAAPVFQTEAIDPVVQQQRWHQAMLNLNEAAAAQSDALLAVSAAPQSQENVASSGATAGEATPEPVKSAAKRAAVDDLATHQVVVKIRKKDTGNATCLLSARVWLNQRRSLSLLSGRIHRFGRAFPFEHVSSASKQNCFESVSNREKPFFDGVRKIRFP